MIDGPPYSKIVRSTWGDRKFLGLSERARYLWFYLLTGPHTTPIPGVIPNVGIGTLGDALKWSPRRVRAHFAEIASAGMAVADWDAGVIYLPAAIRHNEPANPNVILSWRRVPLPQCELITRALCGFRLYFATKDNAVFADAFDQAFRKRFPDVFNDPPPGADSRKINTNPNTDPRNVAANATPGPEGFQQPFPEGFAESLPEPRSGSVPRISPLPPVNGGPVDRCGNVENRSTDIRVLRSDRREAEAIRQKQGTCPHTPTCTGFLICVERIAVGIAMMRDSIRRPIH